MEKEDALLKLKFWDTIVAQLLPLHWNDINFTGAEWKIDEPPPDHNFKVLESFSPKKSVFVVVVKTWDVREMIQLYSCDY